MRTDEPEAVDIHVGQMIRAQRKLIGLSQSNLADAIGVSFQQVQKYEKASNRVSASVLVAIAKALGCPPSALLPSEAPSDEAPTNMVMQMTGVRNGLEVAEIFLSLNERDRRVLVTLARSLAGYPPVRGQTPAET